VSGERKNVRHAEVDPACGVDPERVVVGPREARSLHPLRTFAVGWERSRHPEVDRWSNTSGICT